jgi:hypothetical protein
MKESLARDQIHALMNMKPSELGRKLTGTGAGVCPLCHLGGRMAVHENGVQFACGCCRMLPPLHVGPASWLACKKCNDGVVIPMHAGKQRAGAGPNPLTAVEELMREYVGLG